MSNGPTNSSRQGGAPTSLRQRSERAVPALAFRTIFAPTSADVLAPQAPVVALAEGEPWGASTIDGVPLEPEAISLRSARTATRPMRAWFLANALVSPVDGVVLSGRPRKVVAESLNTGMESLNADDRQAARLRRFSKVRPESMAGTVSVLRSPGRNHYHSLVDNLARVCAFGLPQLTSTPVDILYNGPLTPVERFVLDRLRPRCVSQGGPPAYPLRGRFAGSEWNLDPRFQVPPVQPLYPIQSKERNLKG